MLDIIGAVAVVLAIYITYRVYTRKESVGTAATDVVKGVEKAKTNITNVIDKTKK